MVQQGQGEPGMHINNVLPAYGINDSELVVPGRKKLIKGVTRIIGISAAGDVGSKKGPGAEHHIFEGVSANRGDGKRMGRLAIEPPNLISGLQVEIERFGIGCHSRTQRVTVFPGGGSVEGDALPVDVESV